MKIDKLVLSGVLASVTLLGMSAAQATCSTYAHFEQYYTNGSTCYAYVSPAASLQPYTYLYYFTSTDPELCAGIINAKHQTGWISGNATSCPTTGTLRYGGVASGIYAR